MGIKFKTVTKIAEDGVDEAPKVETSEELSLSVGHSLFSLFTKNIPSIYTNIYSVSSTKK